jgi:anthranilate synthase component 1
MDAKQLKLGDVLPLARRITGCPDPLSLFGRLTDGGRRADTLVLESADIQTRNGERSVLFTRCAIRAESRGRAVQLEALTPNGRDALEHLSRSLDAPRDGDALRLTYPPAPARASEDERLTAPSPTDALRTMARSWTLQSRPVPSPLMIAGTFSYDFVEAYESLPDNAEDPLDFPDFVYWLPEEIVIVDHQRQQTTLLELIYGGDSAGTAYFDATNALEDLIDVVSETDAAPTSFPVAPTPDALPDDVDVDMSDAEFAAAVAELKQYIGAGDVFQVVPSRTFSTACGDPLASYRQLRRLNPSPYMFYVRDTRHTVFGASPETSVKVTASDESCIAEIRPIAGTRRRGRAPDGSIDRDLDSRIEAELRLDDKEVAEHMMLVDLARNDIARVSKPGTRHVPRLLTVDRYSHVMHLVSYVAGELRDELDALHAYTASMNMGTLVGAPKIRAAELLRRHEKTRRGPYGGAVGYLTCDGDMDTAIVIRSAVVADDTAYVRAGAGVVHDSVPDLEANETRMKAAAVLRAIQLSKTTGD